MTKPVIVVDGKLLCFKCRYTLPTAEFYRNKNRKCGYATYCKSCQSLLTRTWQKANPEKCRENTRRRRKHHPGVKKGYHTIQVMNGQLPCNGCKQLLSTEQFSVNRARKCGYHSICRACNAQRKSAWLTTRAEYAKVYQKRWRARNAEKLKQYDKDRYWSDPNTHRARVRDRMATPEGRAQRVLWEQQRRARAFNIINNLTVTQWQALLDHYDHRCLACDRKDMPLTRDHIMPLTKGGALTLNNVQPLCRPCNASKKQQVIDYRH